MVGHWLVIGRYWQVIGRSLADHWQVIDWVCWMARQPPPVIGWPRARRGEARRYWWARAVVLVPKWGSDGKQVDVVNRVANKLLSGLLIT